MQETTQLPESSGQLTSTPSEPKKTFPLLPIVGLTIGIVCIVGLALLTFSSSKNKTASSSTEKSPENAAEQPIEETATVYPFSPHPKTGQWFGFIRTPNGLVEINAKGEVVKDANGQIITHQTPWPKELYGQQVKMLKDGRFLISNGQSSEYNVDFKDRNVISSWEFGQAAPQPLIALEPSQRIFNFTLSPDGTKIAIISSQHDVETSEFDDKVFQEISAKYKDVDPEKILMDPTTDAWKEFTERKRLHVEQLKKDMRTLKIYDLTTGKLLHTFAINLPFPEGIQYTSNLVYCDWGVRGLACQLHSLETTLTLYDPDTGQELGSVNSPVFNSSIELSPDQTKYYDVSDSEQVIRSFPDKQIIAKVDTQDVVYGNEDIPDNTNMTEKITFDWGSWQIFSPDSNLFAFQASSIDQKTFIVKELDIAKQQNALILDPVKVYGQKYVGNYAPSLFAFLIYTPDNKGLIFSTLYNLPMTAEAPQKIYYYSRENQSVTVMYTFPGEPGSQQVKDPISFVGWYER